MTNPSFSIYDASAGSGKTYALVKEYLKIILSSNKNDAYRNILAITFTNKAVHEMKSRIVGNLSEFAKDDPNEKALQLMHDLAVEINLSVAQIKTKSQQIIKHIIHNYAAFDISTIDKFTHRVIRAFAHDLNLPMTFEVTLDTENLLAEAVDAIIAQAGEDETLTKLLIEFTMEKTDDDKSWDISREILETGRLLLNENNREEITHFHSKTIDDFMQIKKQLAKICDEIVAENKQLAQNAFDIIDTNSIEIKSFSGAYFPKHLQSIIDGKFNPKNKTYREIEDIKINKTAKDEALIQNFIPQWLTILEDIYKNFEKRDFYKAFLKNITPLSLLNTVSSELSKIQEEQNVLSISAFNALIYNEIQNQPAPFIYERLGERYRHFFIDEFQDTSEMQWKNLTPLIDNALAGEENGQKGTLMIVGDPKQSIYRWRGGKAEQFIELSKKGATKDNNPFSNKDKALFHLDKNYRSFSEVINFNNQLFKMLASEFQNDDYNDLYLNHSYQKSNDKIGGFVSISFLPIIEKNESENDEDALDKSELYVLETLNTIEKVQKEGFDYKDIVVLTRKRDQGIAIANFLTEKNIPLLSSETLLIQNATEVQLIVNLLKYLKNAKDLEAKAGFLNYLANHSQDSLPIHDFIAHGMAFETEKELENWLETIQINLSFQNIRKKSLYEAVEIIISKIINQNAKGDNAYVQYFLDIVLERDVRNQAGISDFLTFWDKNASKFSIPSPEGTNAVRIMTIHKSKGLEFPVVIFPFADEDYSRKPKDKLWLSNEEEAVGLPKVLIDNSSAVEGFGENAKLVYEAKKEEELLDNINVLYVALTRAEEHLHIISQQQKPKKDGTYSKTMATFFIHFLENQSIYDSEKLNYQFGNPKRVSTKVAHIDTSKKIESVRQVLNPKNIKIAQREALMWGTHQQEAIEYGNVIHEILSYIKTKEDLEFAITTAIENGLITKSQEVLVTKTIQDIVTHPDLDLFFDANNTVLNEQTIIQKEGNLVKPDRMEITKDNNVYLLDYKTGVHQPKYKLQLENYQSAIEKMGYAVVKKSLIYIGEKIEVVHL